MTAPSPERPAPEGEGAPSPSSSRPRTAGARVAASLLRPRTLRAAAVLLAGLVLGEVNVLGARHFARFDWSEQRRFTLSQPTRELLRAQREPVEIVSLLTRSDPLYVEARHLLDAYRAESPMLRVRFVDPDRDIAEFRSLELEDHVEPGAGSASVQAAFLVTSGSRRWLVPQSQLLSREDDGRGRDRMEERLTQALVRVADTKRERICFVTGHGERSVEDLGPQGLAELGRRLTQSNLEVARVPLDVPEPARALTDCDVVALIAPERPVPEPHALALARAFSRRANLLLLLDPLVDARTRLAGAGLEPLLRPLGLDLRPGFVLERDPSRRLPQGMGEAFFAQVEPHPVTRGLTTNEQRLDARPILIASQAIALSRPDAAQPLLRSSPRATLLDDLGGAAPDGAEGSALLAVALERPSAPGARVTPSARLVLVGTSNVASADSFREPRLYANRLLIENAFAWLTERPGVVAVPPREAREAPLVLTEESLGELLRYVLFYMPTTTALLGVFVVLRRRSLERRSRQEGA